VARVNENIEMLTKFSLRLLGIGSCIWEGNIKIGMKERTKF